MSKREVRVREALQKIFRARSSVPAIEDLADKLVKAFGGADAFATQFAAVFANAPPMVKAKLLEAATRLIVLADKAKPAADLSATSDEDLMEIARAVTAHAEEEETQDGVGAAVGGGVPVPQPAGAPAPAAEPGNSAAGG